MGLFKAIQVGVSEFNRELDAKSSMSKFLDNAAMKAMDTAQKLADKAAKEREARKVKLEQELAATNTKVA